MTARSLAILGAGEHARVVSEAAGSRPDAWIVRGMVDDDDPDGLGDDEAFLARLAALPAADRPRLVVGIGADLGSRRRAVDRFASLVTWATVVHASAWVSPSADLAPGAVVLAGAVVNAGARVGAHAIVNTGAIVEHDVDLGPFVHVGPAAAIGGGTRVGAGTFVGLGARIRDHIAVGHDAVVGMGAVVVAAVPDRAVVVGVPARIRVGAR